MTTHASTPSARKRPIVIASVYAIEALLASLFAAPWIAAIASRIGNHPDGDRALFLQGGLVDLTELVFRDMHLIAALAKASVAAIAVWFVASLTVQGGLLEALDAPGRVSASELAAAGMRHFGRLALVAVASVVCVGATVLLVGLVPMWMVLGRTAQILPQLSWTLAAIPPLVALVLALYLLAACDMARAMVVRHDHGPLLAVVAALRAGPVTWRFVVQALPRQLASVGLLGFAFALTSGRSVMFCLLLHQSIALGRVALRAAILARALRSSDALVPAHSLQTAGEEGR